MSLVVYTCNKFIFSTNKEIVDTVTSGYIYLFKVNNRNTIKRCEICSKFKTRTNIIDFKYCYFEPVNV